MPERCEIWCGIDPGKKGAIAFFNGYDKSFSVYDMPLLKAGKNNKDIIDEASLCSIFRSVDTRMIRAYVERVNAMPGQGVVSMFNFGMSYGIIRGILASLDIWRTYVPPVTWKRRMGVNASKDGARQRAMELFPSESKLFERKKDDGRAEAALLAMYGLFT